MSNQIDKHIPTLIMWLLAAGVAWGVAQAKVGRLEMDMANHKVFRESVSDRLARVETKIDMIIDRIPDKNGGVRK